MELIQSIVEWLRAYLAPAPRVPLPERAPRPEKPVDEPRALDFAWMKTARSELGTKEVSGDGYNPDILAYWQAVDYQPPDGDETAWCAAFANWCLETAGHAGTRLPNARSFEKWGKKIKRPKEGCVVVFWRKSPTSWKGHVAFYVGPGRPGYIKVLGGNQSNSVNIAEYPESRVLSYRVPVTGGNSRTFRGVGLAAAGVGVAHAADMITAMDTVVQLGGEFKALSTILPYATEIGVVITLVALAVIAYARMDDAAEKGR